MIHRASTSVEAPPFAGAEPREIASPMPDVRLWLVELDGVNDSRARHWLSASEEARALRFRFDVDANRYRTGHAALRQLLFCHSDVLPATEFELGHHGKPAAGDRPFNTSDSGDLLLVAIRVQGGGAIGVDLEVIRPMNDCMDLARRHFSPEECWSLHSVPPRQTVRSFLRGWTRKEACLKAVGLGLNVDTSTIEVGLDRSERVVTVPSASGTTTVRLYSIEAGDAVVAALVVVDASASEPLR